MMTTANRPAPGRGRSRCAAPASLRNTHDSHRLLDRARAVLVLGMAFVLDDGSDRLRSGPDDPARCAGRNGGRHAGAARSCAERERNPGHLHADTATSWSAGTIPTGSAGYSPLGIYGDQTSALYGPMSAFRVSTAPVLGYSRGYDGQIRAVEANSFSYPNLPSLSPVVYPTESNYYWGPEAPRTPRWGSSAINWIDQN